MSRLFLVHIDICNSTDEFARFMRVDAHMAGRLFRLCKQVICGKCAEAKCFACSLGGIIYIIWRKTIVLSPDEINEAWCQMIDDSSMYFDENWLD